MSEDQRRRDLCDLFAAVTMAVVFHARTEATAEHMPTAREHDGDTSDEGCPRCPRTLHFESDVLTGLVYEACACGYAARLSPARGAKLYLLDQRRLARECGKFPRPPAGWGQHRDVADAA